jgi:uncharacterized protein with HEPN domain
VGAGDRREADPAFVAGRSWEDYSTDLLLRSGVERQLEIAGEAMSVLRHLDPETAARVPNVHKIIGMRNILIHGYAEVTDLTVWRTATEGLDDVVTAVEEAGPADPA